MKQFNKARYWVIVVSLTSVAALIMWRAAPTSPCWGAVEKNNFVYMSYLVSAFRDRQDELAEYRIDAKNLLETCRDAERIYVDDNVEPPAQLSLLDIAVVANDRDWVAHFLDKNIYSGQLYSNTTSLHLAAAIGASDVIDLLTNGRPSVLDWRSDTGTTALMMVPGVVRSRDETAKALIRAGVNVDLSDDNGWTALHHAVLFGDALTTNVLIDAGVDPCIKNAEGYRAADMGRHENLKAVVREYAAKRCCNP